MNPGSIIGLGSVCQPFPTGLTSSPSPPSMPTPPPTAPSPPLPDAATTDSATASQRQRLDSVTTDEVQQLDSATAQPTPDHQWLVLNQNTMPYKPGADPLKEPARPQRDRTPVDRYTATPRRAVLQCRRGRLHNGRRSTVAGYTLCGA
eukprot:scaffold145675_cov139-Phaeocystis_antarctica.AAC.2